MKAVFSPSLARGSITAPPSKSMAHRAMIAAALATGESCLSPIAFSEDMLATTDALAALGATFTRDGETVLVQGFGGRPQGGKPLCCRESGSTLRFLIPLCLLTGETYTLTGAPRLLERPLSVYEALCRDRGFLFEKGEASLTVQGKLSSGEYTVPGNISSQFITGLLFALSLVEGESVLHVTGPWESASYVDMTLSAMAEFGVQVQRHGDAFSLRGSVYSPRSFTVESDWSNAAFLEALTMVGGKVQVLGLREGSLQGDRVYRRYFQALREGKAEIDLSDCPDLAPVLFALAAFFHGARFTGTRRLAMKESDRGEAMAKELAKCGVVTERKENTVTVSGGMLCPPTEEICGHNDHRIVMAMSVLLSRLGGTVTGAEAVRKSYPDFFGDLKKLGIKVKIN